jgi:ribulose 1,5-bisphosphate synthetase/thiazole synthase
MVSCYHKAVKIRLISSNRSKGERIPQKQGVNFISEVCAPRTLQRRCEAASLAKKHEADVLVLGAGIIGLACAREMLRRDTTVSVTVLDAGKGLCAGATGAGQGYGACVTFPAYPVLLSQIFQLSYRHSKLAG